MFLEVLLVLYAPQLGILLLNERLSEISRGLRPAPGFWVVVTGFDEGFFALIVCLRRARPIQLTYVVDGASWIASPFVA